MEAAMFLVVVVSHRGSPPFVIGESNVAIGFCLIKPQLRFAIEVGVPLPTIRAWA
jgi:hypothetical protein